MSNDEVTIQTAKKKNLNIAIEFADYIGNGAWFQFTDESWSNDAYKNEEGNYSDSFTTEELFKLFLGEKFDSLNNEGTI